MKGLMSKDRLLPFWQSVQTFIIERISMKQLKKRAFVRDDEF